MEEFLSDKPVVAHSVVTWLPLTMTWIFNQVRALNGFSAVVLTDAVQNTSQFPWGPVFVAGRERSRLRYRLEHKLGLRAYPEIYDLAFEQYRPALLHSHFADRGWQDMALAHRYSLKQVVTFYGFDVQMLPAQQSIWVKRYQELFNSADLFLCEGPYMAQSVIALGCIAEKVRVQHLGVDLDRIHCVPRSIAADGLIKILIIGTFREKKGITYALEALGALKARYPNLRITIIGDSTGSKHEEAEKQRILDVLRRYRLESITRCLGFKPQAELFAEAYDHHILLAPSVTAADGDTEGGAPVSIIEMAASGMLVVSSRHADIPMVIQDRISGLLAQERNVQDLINSLEWLLSQPEIWGQMAAAARAHIEREFSLPRQVERLEACYREILS